MSHVSVIGTGAMGSALVEAFAASGVDVTVWNRTAEKAQALSSESVQVAESLAEALAASPLIIVSVSDYETTRSLVEEAGERIAERVIASTAFVAPEQGRDFEAAVEAAGGQYLDLSIPAYPNEVRSGTGRYLVSGSRAAYEAHRERFERLGRATFVDEAPGAAFVSEMTVLLAYLPMAVSMLQGLRICEQQGIPAQWFRETMLELYPFHIQSLLDRVSEEPDPLARRVEASIDQWRMGAADYADYLRQAGLDAGMYDALNRLFSAASERGYGEADWTGIVEYAERAADRSQRPVS